MKIEKVKTPWQEGQFPHNTYVVSTENDCIIIDAGAKTSDLLDLVAGKKVRGIFITHSHYDHVLYIEEYESLFKCPIYLDIEGMKFLCDPNLNASEILAKPLTFSLTNTIHPNDEESISIDSLEITAYYTPGHSSDSMSYLVEDRSDSSQIALFSGDIMYAKAIGRCDLPTVSQEQLDLTIDRLLTLPFTVSYPGHARATTKEEQLHNREERSSTKV